MFILSETNVSFRRKRLSFAVESLMNHIFRKPVSVISDVMLVQRLRYFSNYCVTLNNRLNVI